MQFYRKFYLSLQYYKAKQFSVSTYLVNIWCGVAEYKCFSLRFSDSPYVPPFLWQIRFLFCFFLLFTPKCFTILKNLLKGSSSFWSAWCKIQSDQLLLLSNSSPRDKIDLQGKCLSVMIEDSPSHALKKEHPNSIYQWCILLTLWLMW